MDDTAGFFGGADAEGMGFERVEAERVVLAVPLDGAQGHKADR